MKILQRANWLTTATLLLTAMLLALLLGRVSWLLRHVSAAELEKLRRQNTQTQLIMPRPGTIMANEGTVLAASVRKYNLYADPGYILDPEAKLNSLKGEDLIKARQLLAEALAPLLKQKPQQVSIFMDTSGTYANGKPRRFLWLAREVDEEFYNQFQAAKARYRQEGRDAAKHRETAKARTLQHALDGVGFVESTRRMYPLGTIAGQVVGFRNLNGGLQGLENQLDDLLKGRPGQMLQVKDASRKTLWIQEEGYRPPDDGRSVWLTIDTVIQGIAEEELLKSCKNFNAHGGVAIVMDPFTGHILAMANYPSFNPANYAKTAVDAQRNRAVTDPYEPGSIFKPFVAAWALENKTVRLTDVLNCNLGRFHDPTGRLVTDTHGYGMLSVEDILVHSSNIGMTQIGWKMGIPSLFEGVRAFGFGDLTGAELPGDQKGVVHPLAAWNKGTLTSVSFGYDVSATPLQLLRAFCTFSNDGYLVTPRILQAVEDRPGHAIPWQEVAGPAFEKQILSPETCAAMRQALEGVYTRGTAKKAMSPSYRFFGKTGTAHLAIRGAKHYASDRYNSSFLAGGPASQPQLVALMTLHDPDRSKGHFGGTVAAPGCTKILERSLLYMQVPPDQKPELLEKKPTSPLARSN